MRCWDSRPLDDAPESRRQVAVADRFIVTKSDLAVAGVRDELMERLQRANPAAPAVMARNGHVPAEELIGEASSLAFPAGFEGAGARHSANITSFALIFEAPIAWEVYERAMGLLVSLRGEDILRSKGLLDVAGCKGPVVVHQVQHLASAPVELERWPGEDRRSRLVFITRGIGRGEVETLYGVAMRLAQGLSVPTETVVPERPGVHYEAGQEPGRK